MANNKKNIKLPVIIGAVVLLIVVVGIVVWKVNSKPQEVAEEQTNQPKKRISVPANIIAISERPYIEVEPFMGSEGRSLRITVNNLEKNAKAAEYILETEVNGAAAKNASGRDIAVPETENPVGLQGAMGEIDIKSLPASAESLLGSCSAGGACIHYSGLGGGKVQVTFSGGDENYAVANGFNYIENTSKKETIATSKDQLFTIEGASLATMQNYVITQSTGLPNGLTGTVVEVADSENTKDNAKVALAYQLSSMDEATSGELTVTIQGEGTIYAYSKANKTWTALETKMESGSASATSEWADIFALVK